MRMIAAAGFWLAVLDMVGCDGLTMPWRTVYVRRSCLKDPGLIAHETAHIRQIERMGPVWFSIVYLYQLLRFGYERMPMEIEANEAQSKTLSEFASISKFS